MSENQLRYLNEITDYVVTKMKSVDAGHDFSHIQRVLHNAREINKTEKADAFFVEASALLHDITDEKLFDKIKAEDELRCFLTDLGLDLVVISQIIENINLVSFGTEFDGKQKLTLEQKIIRDADRLDAIGAVGIARTFHYGGSKNREIYNAEIPPQKYQSTKEYRKSTSPTINHFYEKLLLLKDKMETHTGKTLAKERHLFMLEYLKRFYLETGESGFGTDY